MDLHRGLEYAAFHGHWAVANLSEEVAIKGYRLVGWRRFVETGPLSAPAIAIESKLGNYQHRTTCLDDVTVHLPIFIGKNPKSYKLIHEVIHIFVGISPRDPDKHQQTGPDSSGNVVIHTNAGFLHTLDNKFHDSLSSILLQQESPHVIVCGGETMPRGRNIQDVNTLQMALVGYQIERQKIEDKIREIQGQLKGGTAVLPEAAVTKRTGVKRVLSPAARRRIALAQKRRWAEHRKRAAQAAKHE